MCTKWNNLFFLKCKHQMLIHMMKRKLFNCSKNVQYQLLLLLPLHASIASLMLVFFFLRKLEGYQCLIRFLNTFYDIHIVMKFILKYSNQERLIHKTVLGQYWRRFSEIKFIHLKLEYLNSWLRFNDLYTKQCFYAHLKSWHFSFLTHSHSPFMHRMHVSHHRIHWNMYNEYPKSQHKGKRKDLMYREKWNLYIF